MKSGTGILIGTGVVGAAGYYFYQLKKTGDALKTETKLKVHSFSLVDVTIQADTTLHNQGDVSLKLSNIQVQVFFPLSTGERVPIITSRPSSTSVVVQPGQSGRFQLLLDSAKVPDLIKKIGQENYRRLITTGIRIITVTKATVNGFIPTSEEQVMTLSINGIS